MRAWFAKADALEQHVADRELRTDEMVELDSFRHDITAGIGGREWEAGFSRKSFDAFFLDQGDFEVGLLRVWGESSGVLKVAITLEANAGNGVAFGNGYHWESRAFGD